MHAELDAASKARAELEAGNDKLKESKATLIRLQSQVDHAMKALGSAKLSRQEMGDTVDVRADAIMAGYEKMFGVLRIVEKAFAKPRQEIGATVEAKANGVLELFEAMLDMVDKHLASMRVSRVSETFDQKVQRFVTECENSRSMASEANQKCAELEEKVAELDSQLSSMGGGQARWKAVIDQLEQEMSKCVDRITVALLVPDSEQAKSARGTAVSAKQLTSRSTPC